MEALDDSIKPGGWATDVRGAWEVRVLMEAEVEVGGWGF